MHRGTADPHARLERTLAQRVVPAVHSQRMPVRLTVAHLPGEPISFDEAVALPHVPIAVGDWWGPPWSTSWFRLEATVPPDMAGKVVELVFNPGWNAQEGPGFSAEALAYTADGTPIKGVEPRTAWLPISESARAGYVVDIHVEAAANPRIVGFESTPLGDPLTATDKPLYQVLQAELVVVEPEVRALAMDMQVLKELAPVLPQDEPRARGIWLALQHAMDALDLRDVVGTAPQARALLAEPLSRPATPSAPFVSAVGHAHIDSAWLWPVRETIRKCSRTFANVLDLCDTYSDFVFAASSAQQYAWVKEAHPQIFDGIASKITTGAFVPVGGMWVESDANLPGGESMVRQLVEGKRFFLEEFGVDCSEVWLPDSFGYSAALPQLFRLAGSRYFLSQKLSWNQTNSFPHHTFWWQGIDGSRVFAHFPPSDTYSSELTAEQLAFGMHNFRESAVATRSLMPFGFGDGGGGPTREMMEIAHRVRNLEGSPKVTIEAPEKFFVAAEAEYPDAPVWDGELYLEFHRGVYTSQHRGKQGNRRTEALLHEAELWCAHAAVVTDAPYPYDELRRLWRQTLLLQFHDILPGSSIAWVHRETEENYRQIAGELEPLITSAQRALAGDGEVPLIFNAAPDARHGIAAMAADQGAEETLAVSFQQKDAGSVVLDNGLVRLRIDADGTIGSVFDLVAQREVLVAGSAANVLQLHPDAPVRFDAWDIDSFYRNTIRQLWDVTDMTVTTGDFGARVTVTRDDNGSHYVQVTTLAPGTRRIDFELSVDWRARETLLKAAFAVDVHADVSSAEVQFGHVRRPIHTNSSVDAARFEIWAHRWIHVAEPGYGVALANDSSYGHDVTRAGQGDARGSGGTTVRLSLLRAPLFPDPETDQGHHTLRYALVVGADIDDARREGYSLNLPERVMSGAAAVPPLFDAHGDGVLETVKLADDRSGDVVVRIYEPRGGRGHLLLRPSFGTSGVTAVDLLEREDDEVAALTVLERDQDGAVALKLRPFQIVTLRFHRASNQPRQETP